MVRSLLLFVFPTCYNIHTFAISSSICLEALLKFNLRLLISNSENRTELWNPTSGISLPIVRDNLCITLHLDNQIQQQNSLVILIKKNAQMFEWNSGKQRILRNLKVLKSSFKIINSEFLPIGFILGNEQVRLSESNYHLNVGIEYL